MGRRQVLVRRPLVMAESPMTPTERRRRVVEADPNASLRMLLAIATELADALEKSSRRRVVDVDDHWRGLDQPAGVGGPATVRGPTIPAVEPRPVVKPPEHVSVNVDDLDL